MRILCHRGHWLHPEEKNTLAAFARALAAGDGIETDVRDRAGALVIAHDPATPESPTLDALLELHSKIRPDAPLALNIKADGLAPLLAHRLRQHPGAAACFFFDMSAPESLRYRIEGLRFFTRQSEIEPQPLLIDSASGVWIDCFERDWVEDTHLATHLAAGRTVVLVSPELHGRDPMQIWDRLHASPWRNDPRLLLCTDRPDTARETIFAS